MKGEIASAEEMFAMSLRAPDLSGNLEHSIRETNKNIMVRAGVGKLCARTMEEPMSPSDERAFRAYYIRKGYWFGGGILLWIHWSPKPFSVRLIEKVAKIWNRIFP